MKLISFDVLRTLHLPISRQLKPEQIFSYKQELSEADWVLYPEYWQINALHFALKCRVYPSLATFMLGHNKIEMTRAFEAIVPAHVPLTRIHGNTPERAQQIWDTFSTPFVAKLVRSSMGEGVFLIETREDWRKYCNKVDVLYVQEYLPIDRDLRLVVIGEKVVSAYWRLQSDNGFHNNIARGGHVSLDDIPESAITLVENTAKLLGIDHAGFDVAMVDNYPFLIEFNRLFGTSAVTIRPEELAQRIFQYLKLELEHDNDPKPRSPFLVQAKNIIQSKKRRKKAA